MSKFTASTCGSIKRLPPAGHKRLLHALSDLHRIENNILDNLECKLSF